VPPRLSAGADRELAISVRIVVPGGVQVVAISKCVGVPDEEEVGAGCQEVRAEIVRRPEGVVVPVREQAPVRMRGEVGAQPLLLGAARRAADVAAVRVESDQVPRAEVEGVVALARVAGGRSEVGVVAARARRLVFVIPGRGRGDGLQLSPREVVGVLELAQGAALVLLVSEREHAVGCDVDKELSRCRLLACARGGFCARPARDVAGGGHDGIGCGRRPGRQENAEPCRQVGQPSIAHLVFPPSPSPLGVRATVPHRARAVKDVSFIGVV
jgi:hypothetical protein